MLNRDMEDVKMQVLILKILHRIHPTTLGESLPLKVVGPCSEQERIEIEKVGQTARGTAEGFRRAMMAG
jgi:hypothetical protein